MHRIFFAICISCLLIASCSDDNSSDDPLSQPPYDNITDSIRKAPSDAELYFRRGSLLSKNNQPVFAERDLRKAWELQPKEEYALKLVEVLKLKDPDSSIFFLNQALKKLPRNVFLQIGLAIAYKEKKQLDQALSICNDIISR